jgi:putative adenylate-forming enzyme
MMRMVHIAITLCAFVRARWGFRFANRNALLTWQTRRRDHYLNRQLRRFSFYQAFVESPFSALPVINKQAMLESFAGFNRYGITLEQAHAIALRAEGTRDFKAEVTKGITVGLSSGTSGTRGVYLVSETERARWAGVILARVLSTGSLLRVVNPFARALKVAFLLRANSNLYDSVRSTRIDFQFGDLLQPLHNLSAWLNAWQTDLLIAPASVLKQLAQMQLSGRLKIWPQQVVSVAEVLEENDRDAIQRVWRVPVTQVYQCTEGLLAYTCKAGRIHLNEEYVHFEEEWLDNTATRFSPILTDFSRQTQGFIRYRLDDVLRVDPTVCSCGKVTRTLASIEGRRDDVLWLPPSSNCEPIPKEYVLPVFPDMIRRAFVMAGGSYGEYDVEQHGTIWRIRLQCRDYPSETSGRIRQELVQLCQHGGVLIPEMQFAPWQPPNQSAKRRRIRCVAPPRQESIQ